MVKTKSLRILIPNATSPRNIGDLAMLEVLVALIKSTHKNSSITVHSVDTKLYKNKDFRTKDTLYSWSVFRNKNSASRISRILKLILVFFLLSIGINNPKLDKKLGELINDYRNADLIIFAGGGYLRSKKGLTQSLNLFMQLSVFMYATLFKAKKIVSPISVGPFAYKWHEGIVVKVLKQMDLVALREEFSYQMLKKNKMRNIVLSSDYALMTKRIGKKEKQQRMTLGFTVRDWLNSDKSANFENSLTNTIIRFSKLTGAKIQPIVQVSASKYGEDDVKVTNKIAAEIRKENISVLETKRIITVKNALETYSSIDLLLGMRMHSNILAAIQRTPFVAISYEHKTEGIAKNLGMEKYCIKCEEINDKNLYKLLVEVYEKRNSISNKLDASLITNLKTEQNNWNNYLRK